jgi:Domain of unknown function (DUF4062)
LARVYVSSTIADLTGERQAVLDWLRLARHQAVDSYLPDSDTVRGSCLEDVAACDLYVLILGHRYGFQPPQDNPEGLSITRLEFRRAGECGIPRVALLRTSIPDVRLSDLQDPARARLVLAFRDEVADHVRSAEFSDLKGLIQGLSTGIQAELDKLDKREKRPDGPVLPDAQDERGGVIAGERVHDVNGPARRGRAGLVFRVSRGCSVCRGDLGDRGPGGGVVDEVLAGAGGGDQGGGADVVDGSRLAAGGLVDLGDRVLGEKVGGAPGLLEVMADVAGGLVGGHALHLVADGDPLLQCR